MISYLGAKWNNRSARLFADSKKKKKKTSQIATRCELSFFKTL